MFARYPQVWTNTPSPILRRRKLENLPSILHPPHGGGPSGKEPILVEPGDKMRMSFTPLHTDPDIWGETALDFLPERWAGPKQSWNYITFMGGRRICPAQQNALTDVAFVLATFARNFKVIENQGPHLEYVDIITFTRECGDGVQIAFVPIYDVGAHRRKIYSVVLRTSNLGAIFS
ncbi:hypothetical protein QC760_006642 [Botrytis cinerea]